MPESLCIEIVLFGYLINQVLLNKEQDIKTLLWFLQFSGLQFLH